jgi:hypothetical protein
VFLGYRVQFPIVARCLNPECPATTKVYPRSPEARGWLLVAVKPPVPTLLVFCPVCAIKVWGRESRLLHLINARLCDKVKVQAQGQASG